MHGRHRFWRCSIDDPWCTLSRPAWQATGHADSCRGLTLVVAGGGTGVHLRKGCASHGRPEYRLCGVGSANADTGIH